MTTALAILTRNIGITLVFSGILIVIRHGGKRLSHKTVHASVFTSLAVLPYAIRVVRTWLVSGTLSGPGAPSRNTLADIFSQFADTISSWFFPAWFFPHFFEIGWVVFLIFLWGAAALCAIRSLVAGDVTQDVANAIPAVIFISVYSIVIVGIKSRIEIDPLDNRLLSPIYISIMMIGIWSMNPFLSVVKWPRLLHSLAGLEKVIIFGSTLVLLACPAHLSNEQEPWGWRRRLRYKRMARGFLGAVSTRTPAGCRILQQRA
jgi:hypothetical protein